MNNILGYNDYINNIEEQIILESLNDGESVEKKGGIRWLINKKVSKKVNVELADEIEMSKSIMDGIKSGLDSIDEGMSNIKDKIDDSSKKERGVIDDILKIIGDSKKQTWDLKELIDEGEIDYAGFTGNVSYASIRYFGVVFFPLTYSMLIHKAYNYFFGVIKNTIRKSLVMLQLNFDQFENLIIQKSFQGEKNYQAEKLYEAIVSEYTAINRDLFDSEKGSLRNTRGKDILSKKLKALEAKRKAEIEGEKRMSRGTEDMYGSLWNDQYNNTYTKTLETLKQYESEDSSKQLESIKTSMSKIAGQDSEMLAFSELLIAMAEEHALKVSSSIYNRFTKLASVFSLPNQKKLIDLIQKSTEETQKALEDERKKKLEEANFKEKEEELTKFEEDGKKIFTDNGGKLGKFDDENKYKDGIDGEAWTWETYNKLEDNDRDFMKKWFNAHPEVVKECDPTLRVAFPLPGSFEGGYFDYIDLLIDEIGPSLDEIYVVTEGNFIKNFDNYFELNESKKIKSKNKKYIIRFSKNKGSKSINDAILKMFTNEKGKVSDVAKVALKIIAKDIVKNNTLSKDEVVNYFVSKIVGALKVKSKRSEISKSKYDLLKDAISKLKDERNHDYPVLNGIKQEDDRKEKKSEE